MIVKLKRASGKYRDLTAGQQYVVIGIEADDLRILNDHGRPFLYPRVLFRMIDSTEPKDWIDQTGGHDERYAYPKALNAPGFFEDFFDGDAKAVATFWRTVNGRLAKAG